MPPLPLKSSAVIALVLAAAAGLTARSDRQPRLVISASTIAEAPVPAPNVATAAAPIDPFLDPTRSLAALRVDFIAISYSDSLIDPGAVHGPALRPIGQRRPLQAALRPLAPAIAIASLPMPPVQTGLRDIAPVVLASLPTSPEQDLDQPAPGAVRGPEPPGGDAKLAQPAVAAVQAPEPPGADEPVQDTLQNTPPQDTQPQGTPLPPPAPRERLVIEVPLPAPRPADLLASIEPTPAPAAPQPTRRTRMRTPPAETADNRTFFEKLLAGGQQRPSSGPALAYAQPQAPAASVVRNAAPSFSLFGGSSAATAGTAVYNISARTVYLPSGERLEAHSGLGDKLDDPRQVSVKMRGATPPSVYDLTEREDLFHGVRAIRLTPVAGTGAVYGRVGLLAHTYMLGPRGDSNGCISFRDYNRFLQAYLKGDIKRLVVVAGT